VKKFHAKPAKKKLDFNGRGKAVFQRLAPGFAREKRLPGAFIRGSKKPTRRSRNAPAKRGG